MSNPMTTKVSEAVAWLEDLANPHVDYRGKPNLNPQDEDAIRTILSALSERTKGLAQLSQPRDCGCVPCRGQCVSQESLLIENDNMRDIARKALGDPDHG